MSFEILTAQTNKELRDTVSEFQQVVQHPHLVKGVFAFTRLIGLEDAKHCSLGTAAISEGDYLAVTAYDDDQELDTAHIDLPTDGLASVRGVAEPEVPGYSELDASLGILSSRVLTEAEGQLLISDLRLMMLFSEHSDRKQ